MSSTNLDVTSLPLEEILAKFRLSKEEYLKLDETEFRARFRERVHHSLEIQTYDAIHSGKILSEDQTKVVKDLINIWKERGLSTELPDFKSAQNLLALAEAAQKGEKVSLSKYKPHEINEDGYKIFDYILKERRSVRHWTDKEIPEQLIDILLESGLWAAHSCNLQSIRYTAIREKNEPGLFLGSDIPGGPVHIVLLQDERVYRANPFNPERNRLLDVGAAAQNIVLTAHALGLGGVWLTFNNKMLERLRERLNLPEYVKIVTYVDVGYPDETPAPSYRLGLDEVVLARI